MTEGEEVANLIEDTADLLERSGWCQHTPEDSQGRHCITGALGMVQPSSGLASQVETVILKRIHKNGSKALQVETWNDYWKRTEQEVLDTLRQAAKDARTD